MCACLCMNKYRWKLTIVTRDYQSFHCISLPKNRSWQTDIYAIFSSLLLVPHSTELRQITCLTQGILIWCVPDCECWMYNPRKHKLCVLKLKMHEEDKAAADCLHRDTMTVSQENIFTSVSNGFASWAKPLNKGSARNRKTIHYSVQLIVINIGLACEKCSSTVFRNAGENGIYIYVYISDRSTLPNSGHF